MAKYKIYQNPTNNYTEKVKEGFNWVVFFFGPLWYLFNGMIGQGIAWLLVAILAGIFTFGIGAIIVWIICGAKANKDKEKKYLRAGWKFIGYKGQTIQDKQDTAQGTSKNKPTIESHLSKDANEDKKEPVLHVPGEIDDCKIAYKYENVEIAGVQYSNVNYDEIHLCDKLNFALDPENKYDKNAIKIMDNNKLLGYVHKGKMQGMIRDWLERQEPIYASITNIDKDNNSISFFLGFYKSPLDGIENYDSIDTSLTKTTKKDFYNESRQDNFDSINKDDILSLQYDEYEDYYTVTNDFGEELGELSKSVSQKIRSKEDKFELIPVVQEITEDDNGKYGADITIYFKPKQ